MEPARPQAPRPYRIDPTALVERTGRRWRDLCGRGSRPRVSRYERVLGTVLELRIEAARPSQARQAEGLVLNEIDRLEAIFSRFDPGSELNRWQGGQTEHVSPDLARLLRAARGWLERTDGAFNPAVEAVQTVYRRNSSPDPNQLESLRAGLRGPLWVLDGDRARKLTPLDLNFNALAKGRIADLACETAMRLEGVRSAWVNLGGDLRHRGRGDLRVAIAHPFSSADNAPALAQLLVGNQGIATSGHTQRGAHLFDPRTVRPVVGVAQATVIASDCASADALSTAVCALEVNQGLALANRCGAGCLIVTASGEIHTNARLRAQLVEANP